MRNLKLHNDRGETLIEVLAAILIATLSVALLFTCVMASSKIARDAETLDKEHYNAFSEADAQKAADPTPSPTSGTVTVKRTDSGSEVAASPAPTIQIYGNEGMYSYRWTP